VNVEEEACCIRIAVGMHSQRALADLIGRPDGDLSLSPIERDAPRFKSGVLALEMLIVASVA